MNSEFTYQIARQAQELRRADDRLRLYRQARFQLLTFVALGFLAAALCVVLAVGYAEGSDYNYGAPGIESVRQGPKPKRCPETQEEPSPDPTQVVCPPPKDTFVNVTVVPKIERCRRVVQRRNKTVAYGCRVTLETHTEVR